MNRKPRPVKRNNAADVLSDWRQQLMTRRRLLMAAAGGSFAALFPAISAATNDSKQSEAPANPWPVIDAVQQYLFPVEDKSPGAREINALGYLRFVVADTTLDNDSREFITRGAVWLEGMAFQLYRKSYVKLNNDEAEKVLQRIARSESGENWLSTLLLYIVEALLTDPVYGGNTEQRGWKWLQHVPGYPRPPVNKTFLKLL